MRVGGQRHVSAALPPRRTRYPLYRRLGRPQGRSGRVRKISPPPEFDSRTVQPVASHYTDWAIPKIKQSYYRPGPGPEGSRRLRLPISRQMAHEGGKVVSPTHRPPLPPRKYSWYSFLLEAESTPGSLVHPEGLCQWKIPVTPTNPRPSGLWRSAPTNCATKLWLYRIFFRTIP